MARSISTQSFHRRAIRDLLQTGNIAKGCDNREAAAQPRRVKTPTLCSFMMRGKGECDLSQVSSPDLPELSMGQAHSVVCFKHSISFRRKLEPQSSQKLEARSQGSIFPAESIRESRRAWALGS